MIEVSFIMKPRVWTYLRPCRINKDGLAHLSDLVKTLLDIVHKNTKAKRNSFVTPTQLRIAVVQLGKQLEPTLPRFPPRRLSHITKLKEKYNDTQ